MPRKQLPFRRFPEVSRYGYIGGLMMRPLVQQFALFAQGFDQVASGRFLYVQQKLQLSTGQEEMLGEESG